MTRGRALISLAAVLALAAPQAAFGHTIKRSQIRAAAKQAAASIRSETGASSASVLSCRRLSDHRARCKVETRYTSGASRCVTVVSIRLVGQRTSWRAGESTCY